MPTTAFFLEITLASILISSISASFQQCISCPCGSSDQNYTHCLDESLLADLSCERWSNCQTCKANKTFCVSCPPGRFGPSCSKSENLRRKRQDEPNLLSYPRQSGPCPFLERPDSGSIRCSQTGNERSCTARCLPGYFFEGEENVDEITLRCRRGIWTPRRSFPPCRSGGHCELRVTGAGFYNCTIDMEGTHCDITCDGWHQGRFHCYPGREWDPALPPCTLPKEQKSCLCRNGGVCDDGGRCRCPQGRTGTYCENLERQRATCPDPGIPRYGNRLNPDGSDASYPRTFEEGESLIFTCNGEDFALQGSSFITCSPDGTWSANRPRCVRAPTEVVREPPVENSCGHPGVDVNGIIEDHVLLDPRRRGQKFPPGTELRFHCNEGYQPEGATILSCLRTGEWSSAPPTCRKMIPVPTEIPIPQGICKHPGVDVNGRIENQPVGEEIRRMFPVDTALTYSCNHGYEPEGPTVIYCLNNGEWSSVAPSCRRVAEPSELTQLCPAPIIDRNAVVDELRNLDPRKLPGFEPGHELTFSCRGGYDLEGSQTIRCLPDGQWSDASPICHPQVRVPDDRFCPAPEVDPNGVVEEFLLDPRKLTQSFERGAELTFRCRSGYVLEGWSTIRCSSNGKWSSPSPRCHIKGDETTPSPTRCEKPDPINNGRMHVFRPPGDISSGGGEDDEDLPFGTHIKYKCDDGFFLQGDESMSCESTSYWSGSPPICVEDCGRSLVSNTDRVTNGNRTFAGEWPWTVAIAAVPRNGVPAVVCGGALLDRRTVLTAAHCLTGAENFVLYFGKHNRSIRYDDKEVKVGRSSRLLLHPGFDEETFDNDIAIVKFQPDVRYSERIQPVCLPTRNSTHRNLVPERKGYVTGWGINEHQVQSDELMLAHLPVQSDKTCLEAYHKRELQPRLYAGKFCAGYPGGFTSTCRGDSGSPLVFYDRDSDRHVIEGIVSFGIVGDCTEPEKYTVFAKVSDFMNWIMQNRNR